MNTVQTQNIVHNYLQLLSQRDLENLTALFADHIDWYVPGNKDRAPWLGKRNCKEDVKAFYELLWENTEAISAQIEHIIVDDNFAVITGDFSTRMLQTNNVVDSLFCIQITVNEGLIVKYRLLEDSYAVSMSLLTSEN